jgi:hypothetical protein
MMVVEGLRIKPSLVGNDKDGDRLFIDRRGVDIRRMMEMGILMEVLELKRLKIELMGKLEDIYEMGGSRLSELLELL